MAFPLGQGFSGGIWKDMIMDSYGLAHSLENRSNTSHVREVARHEKLRFGDGS